MAPGDLARKAFAALGGGKGAGGGSSVTVETESFDMEKSADAILGKRFREALESKDDAAIGAALREAAGGGYEGTDDEDAMGGLD